MTTRRDPTAWLTVVFSALAIVHTAPADDSSSVSVRELRRFAIREAHQAVAVDETSFYAISNRTIARYDKTTAKTMEKWTAEVESPIKHLNSGIVVDGRLYCANSNWPQSPLKNSLEIFEAATLQHIERKTFPETKGAINWIDRHRGSWWIVFAFYGEAEVRRTRLVRYNDDWESTGEWTFPESVIKRFLPNSNSGGAFGPNGRLFVTGHDHAELYVLDVPSSGDELTHTATLTAPIAGQGIAWDRSDIGTLYGIVRRTHEVVEMRISDSTK
ncbi:MAG: PQQ-like beta-propeller repeat protein [Planctomycetes bacterium]|nr:PQQ-like beta-propeller repeat protein [Planctomycetota bacterium]